MHFYFQYIHYTMLNFGKYIDIYPVENVSELGSKLCNAG